MKRIAEEIKACWNLGRQEVMAVSPKEGPAAASKEHGTFGNLSSSEANGAPRSRAPKAPAPPSPAQFSPGPGFGDTPQAPSSTTPAAGWGPRITEVLGNEECGSLTDPLEGWPHEEQFWPTTAGRCVRSDTLFTEGIGRNPTHATRSDSDIPTRALTFVGAERVPLEEFWALTEFRDMAAVLKGKDFAVWPLPQRPVCAYRRESRTGARLGEKASGQLAQTPDGNRQLAQLATGAEGKWATSA